MPILFSCPHCGTKSQVADQYAGQSGPCAACGKTVTIPYPNYGPGAGAAVAAGAAGAGAGMMVAAVVGAVVVVSLCVVGILVALLLPAVQSAREAARRMACANNLKQLSLAFQNYHDVNNCFPPAYIPDKDGKPMHSWRVLILPYIEEQGLYSQYDFKQPWDSPQNLRVADRMPKVFQCPSDPDNTNTDYMVLTGKETVFDGAKACRLAEISDGTANTILIVEAKGAATRWTEPKDLDFQKLSFMINGPPGDIGSRHPGGAQMTLCDGSVRFLSKNTSPQTLRALATKAGADSATLP